MYKLVVADLDGTLVHNKEISNKVKQTIKNLQEKGIVFSIATGRHIDGTIDIYHELGCKGPLICSNGAMVYDPVEDKNISINAMTTEDTLAIMEICRRYNSEFLLYSTGDIYATMKGKEELIKRLSKDGKPIPVHGCEFKELVDVVADNILKLLVIEYDPIKYEQVKKEISLISGVDFTQSQTGFIDCGKKFVNKGYGVAQLAEYYDIPLHQVIAFGDQNNDIEMIQTVGFGVAMNNATPQLKVVADFVTGDVREDGFCFAIEMFVL